MVFKKKNPECFLGPIFTTAEAVFIAAKITHISSSLLLLSLLLLLLLL